MGSSDFVSRFGRWAVVAGASEGLGAAFARALGRRGHDLVLVARREGPLASLATALQAELGVQVQTVALDLAQSDAMETLRRTTASLEVGVAVYNAAYAPVGELVHATPEALERVVDVNVRGPLLFARTFAGPMAARGRGAMVLMSSLAGLQGTPRLAAYAGSKAFNTVFAESLWHELRAHGVDVLVSCAGAIRTPGYADASSKEAPGTLDASVVADRTLAALGRGPRFVPGLLNWLASWIVGRLLPRRLAVSMMAASTRELT